MVKSVRKSADFLKIKIVGVCPTDFQVTPTDFLADYHRFFNLWVSLEIGEKNRLIGIRL